MVGKKKTYSSRDKRKKKKKNKYNINRDLYYKQVRKKLKFRKKAKTTKKRIKTTEGAQLADIEIKNTQVSSSYVPPVKKEIIGRCCRRKNCQMTQSEYPNHCVYHDSYGYLMCNSKNPCKLFYHTNCLGTYMRKLKKKNGKFIKCPTPDCGGYLKSQVTFSNEKLKVIDFETPGKKMFEEEEEEEKKQKKSKKKTKREKKKEKKIKKRKKRRELLEKEKKKDKINNGEDVSSIQDKDDIISTTSTNLTNESIETTTTTASSTVEPKKAGNTKKEEKKTEEKNIELEKVTEVIPLPVVPSVKEGESESSMSRYLKSKKKKAKKSKFGVPLLNKIQRKKDQNVKPLGGKTNAKTFVAGGIKINFKKKKKKKKKNIEKPTPTQKKKEKKFAAKNHNGKISIFDGEHGIGSITDEKDGELYKFNITDIVSGKLEEINIDTKVKYDIEIVPGGCIASNIIISKHKKTYSEEEEIVNEIEKYFGEKCCWSIDECMDLNYKKNKKGFIKMNDYLRNTLNKDSEKRYWGTIIKKKENFYVRYINDLCEPFRIILKFDPLYLKGNNELYGETCTFQIVFNGIHFEAINLEIVPFF